MRILLLRIGRLGDMIMILPALLALKKKYPQAQFHLITSKDGLHLFKWLDFPQLKMHLYRRTFPHRILDAIGLKRFLKKEKFDLIYSFQSKKRTNAWLPKDANILQPSSVLTHYALRCLQMVTSDPSQDYCCNYLPFQQEKPAGFLSEYGIKPDTLLIGLHPAWSGFRKKNRGDEYLHRLWPEKSFANLVALLITYAREHKLDLKIMMNLLPEEYALGASINRLAHQQIILMKPEINFKKYLQWLYRLNVLVTPNTGVMHLAASMNKPLVALFSREHPDDCGPFMPLESCRIIRAENCADNGQQGLAKISEQMVFEQVIKLTETFT